MYGYVYITTNLINNKKYIGQHKSDLFDIKYLGSGINIKKSIKKYGKENFKVELLEWCETQDDADEKERYYITKYNTQNCDIGYNITIGGQKRFFTGQTHSDEAKEKMSERAKRRNNHKPTTAGRIYYTNGEINKCIKPEDVEYWESQGFYKGKTCKNITAWNKGLTKETDERLQKISEAKKEKYRNGGSLGCCGIKGNTFGFKQGNIPWNKGMKGFLKGHPNYYLGKKIKDI